MPCVRSASRVVTMVTPLAKRLSALRNCRASKAGWIDWWLECPALPIAFLSGLFSRYRTPQKPRPGGRFPPAFTDCPFKLYEEPPAQLKGTAAVMARTLHIMSNAIGP